MDSKVILFIAALIVAVIYLWVDNNRRRRERIEKKLESSWGKPSTRKITDDEMKVISHYYEDSIENSGADSGYIDDITWNDLDMDRIYKKMNIANSSVGQESLYKMLRIPSDIKKLKETDRLASFFTSDKEKRKSVQRIFCWLGFSKGVSVSDYISLLSDLKPSGNLIHYLSVILIAAAIICCIFVNPVAGIGLVIVAVSFAVISYYKLKASVEPYFICITQIVRMGQAAHDIEKLDIEELSEYNRYFKDAEKDFSSVVKNSGILTSGNVTGSLSEMVLDYVRMLTHIDLIKFNHMLKKLDSHEDKVYELMETLGYIEACICVASFRKQLEYWSRPALSSHGTNMSVTEVFHPLIKEPVVNSITTSKHVLVTGSNASGKSTFLKTIAINALLSQTIYTSTSKEYNAPFYRIYSSMALRDDLNAQNSYYIVEIKSLKRILDAVDKDDKRPVLCFVDEVLRGTNTVERIAASSEILKSLRYKNVLVFAATHDIELTYLLEKYYDNYHFQEEVTDDDVKFNYRLFTGPAVTRNAIKLLGVIGYNKNIIDAAESQAGYFIRSGSWKVD